MQISHIPLDLSGFEDEDIEAIENEAIRRGVSFEEAAKQMLLELAAEKKELARMHPVARLFRFFRSN